MATTPYPLAAVEERFFTRQEVAGRSGKTIGHYRNTFLLLHQFLSEAGHPVDTTSLTSDTLGAIIVWLRDAPNHR